MSDAIDGLLVRFAGIALSRKAVYIQCRYYPEWVRVVTTIQRWGNSLAVRIPRAFAVQTQLGENDSVEISVDGDRIVVSPARREWSLDELVAKIRPSNRHGEVAWGDVAGKEVW